MKIKKKVKGKVPKYAGGGDAIKINPTAPNMNWNQGQSNITAPSYSQYTTDINQPSTTVSDNSNIGWNNSQTANDTKSKSWSDKTSGYIGAAGSMIGSSFHPSDNPDNFNKPSSTTGLMSSARGIAKQIPIAGQFVQLGEGISSGFDKMEESGAKSKNDGMRISGAALSGVFSPSASHSKVDAAMDQGKISKGEAVGYHFLNFLAPSIGSAISNGVMSDKMKNQGAEYNRGVDTSTFAYGGGLDKYNLPSHAQQNSNVPNTHLDGQPVQIDKNETVFRKNGGNYVFSDTLKNITGNTFAKDSKLTENTFKRPYYDSIAENTKNEALEKLTVQNDLAKQMQEMKNHSEKFKFGGSIPKAKYLKGGDNGSGGDIYDTVQGANAYRYYLSKFNTDGEEPVVTDGSSVNWASKGISDQPIVTEQPMNYKLHNTLYDYKNNKKILPSNNPVVTSMATKSNDIPEQKDSNKWGMNGDQMQLAGMLPSIAYNAGMAMQPADKEKALYNPYQDKVKDLYTSRYFNEQPIINENQLDFNKGRADIDGLSTNTRNANLVALNSSMMEANSKARLEGQKINNEYKGQLGQVLDNLGQQRVAEGRRVSEIDAQNKGRKQLFASTAATQSGQALTEAGKAKNQKVTNQIELSALNNIYADFGTKYKNMDDFYKNASIDELIAFKKHTKK